MKFRANLPKWLHDGMAQAVAASTSEKLPVVVLHESGQLHARDYVVVQLGDFVDWFVGQPGGGDV